MKKILSIDLTRVATMLLVTSVMLIMFAVPVPRAQAQSLADLQEQIDQLLVLIAELQERLDAQNAATEDCSSDPDCIQDVPIETDQGSTILECEPITRSMYIGATDATTNGQVTRLQQFLTETGDYTFGRTTGYYGPATEAAVKRFQAREGIVSYGTPATTGYGLVGKRTREAINKYCSTPVSSTPRVETLSHLENNSNDSFELFGLVDPKGTEDTVAWFEWADSPQLLKDSDADGRRNYSNKKSISRKVKFNESATLKGGFVEGETYYYRAGAQNEHGRTYGKIKTFEIDDDSLAKDLTVEVSDTTVASGDPVKYTIKTYDDDIEYLELFTQCKPDIVSINKKGGGECLESTVVRVDPPQAITNSGAVVVQGLYEWTETYTALKDSGIEFQVTGLDGNKDEISGAYDAVNVQVEAAEDEDSDVFLTPVASESEVRVESDGDESGIFTLEFDVKAIGSDIYIPDSAARGQGQKVGAYFAIVDGGGNSVSGGDVSSQLTATADKTGGYYQIREGSIETFTLVVMFDPTETDMYRMQLLSIGFNDVSATPDTIHQLESGEFDTDFLSIHDIGSPEETLTVEVTKPTGGEVLTVGDAYEITWESSSDIDKVSLGWSLGEGSLNWIQDATNIPNTGSFLWDVNVGNFSSDSRTVRISLIGYDTGVGSTQVTSDYFEVVQTADDDEPKLQVAYRDSSAEKRWNEENGDEEGIFSIEYDVTAIGADMYIPSSVERESQLNEYERVNNTVYEMKKSKSVDEYSRDGTYETVLSSTADQDEESGMFVVRAAETETFTLMVRFAPNIQDQFKMVLNSIGYSTSLSGSSVVGRAVENLNYDTEYLSLSVDGIVQGVSTTRFAEELKSLIAGLEQLASVLKSN